MRSWMKPGLALAMAAALIPASVAPASADYYGGGPAFATGLATGIIGMGIIGAARGAPPPYYYGAYDDPRCHPGPLECRTVAPPCFTNEFGASVCPPPGRRCFRRPVCY